MNAPDALRYLAHEAAICHDRDEHEALCLLLPALIRILELQPMDSYEAMEFRIRFKRTLQTDFRFDPEPSTVGCGGET